ncbi:50S ribosomal protein L3 [Aliifodinibius salipaludis]|uniref:Large ribosomal subunit protein uL3 n=1 Tax=Fodinibius salipaludis TaxID=2032627 RepID=A0A2A2G6A5_9BACT|nr:50S ribosomal protein L3 [Aliifodinibius salipaludis]PAU92670.1 50S ribosomal protein L3 [Aliifodinibius salipaludis]
MSSGLIGKKIGMTNVFDDNGKNYAVTVIEVDPNVITEIKTNEENGYEAVQLSAFDKKEKSTSKPLKGHFEKAGTTPKKYIKEFRDFIPEDAELGDELNIDDVFSIGDNVDVVGVSKGKGFTGVVKRHNFSGVGEATHGQHDRQRHPGSIGQASDPARVFPGIKMAGRSGNERNKIKNLTIAKIFSESNLMMVTGSIPGPNGRFVEIYNR